MPHVREGHDPRFILDSQFSKESGISPKACYRNAAPAVLYEKALRHEPDTHLVSSGALATFSGDKTGRCPNDKRVVREPECEDDVWWGPGSPNIEMDEMNFLRNREAAIDFLNFVDRVFVVDGYACWEPSCRLKVRLITSRAYHALFMHNMLIQPTKQELESFGEPDFVIYNGGQFPANKYNGYMSSSTSIDISLKRREMVILGTQYAGEMKKGIFTLLHAYLPKCSVLFLHSGCNMGQAGDVTLFLGLSGTGKTTLSTDPSRPFIGDDEHCWGPTGVFNIEGGCYAKVLQLKQEREPDIFSAIRFGTLLENVKFDEETREVDFDDASLTENTRASYPIHYIRNAHIPCVGGHPRNVILLCCDAFGVLPPVSKLTLQQAMYHFISGYTAKVAGTEHGVCEPEATFSACYAGAFVMWHPLKYAALLADKMQQQGTQAWLINTGWCGGAAGSAAGRRISLAHTRAMVDAIHSGQLDNVACAQSPTFQLQVPLQCQGVPSDLLLPETQWQDLEKFTATLTHLAELFTQNFAHLSHDGSGFVGQDMLQRILQGGPQLAPAAAAQTSSATAPPGQSAFAQHPQQQQLASDKTQQQQQQQDSAAPGDAKPPITRATTAPEQLGMPANAINVCG